MGNEIILKRTLDEYFNKGMEAYSKGQLSIARRNLINAEIQLLKLSSTSSKELAKQRRKRAEEIDQLVIKIEEKMRELKQVSDQGNYSDNPFSKANTKATDGLQFPAATYHRSCYYPKLRLHSEGKSILSNRKYP